MQRLEGNGKVLGEALTSPTLIVEVLSATTEQYDRGEMFAHYLTIASLTEYTHSRWMPFAGAREGERAVFALRRVVALDMVGPVLMPAKHVGFLVVLAAAASSSAGSNLLGERFDDAKAAAKR